MLGFLFYYNTLIGDLKGNAVTDEADIREKAKQFFALWQEQVAATIRNPDAMAAMLKTLLAAQGAVYTSSANTMNQDQASDKNQQSSTASSHGTVPDDLLAARLVRCEARIAELESALKAQSRGTRKRTGKPSTTHAA